MILKNLTKQTVLSTDLQEAKTLKEKSVGLISAAKPYALLFHTRWGIHTFGMKFPIDVLVVDKNKKVVKLKENIKPNTIFLWHPKFSKIIELPKNTIKKTKTKINDLIQFSNT